MFKRLKSLLTKRKKADNKKEVTQTIKPPKSILSDSFCLCCSPGIECSKRLNTNFEEVSDNDSVITIK